MERGVRPDPDQAADLGEFTELLRDLRTWAGSPSYRTLAQLVGPLLPSPRTVSHSTLGDVFQTGRRRLDRDLVVATVRALGLDGPEAENWRRAYLRVAADAKAPRAVRVFRQLPADLPTFTGRVAELRFLLDAATVHGPSAVSVIHGPAGVGKTQLALHAAHELVRSGRCGDIQLYVDLHGADRDQQAARPSSALGSLLRQLGVPTRQIPTALGERAAMYRDRLRGRQSMVLLDDIWDEEQIRPLLPEGPDCVVLATSRQRLDLGGAMFLSVDVFSPGEATDLLRRIIGDARVRAEPAAAGEIAELCGHLPRKVALSALQLRSRPVWSLAAFLERFRQVAPQ